MPHQRRSDGGRRPAGEEGGLRGAPGHWRNWIADASRDAGSQHQWQPMGSAGRGKNRREGQTIDAGLARERRVTRRAQVGILMKQSTSLCKNQRDYQQQPERPGVLRSPAR